MSDSSTDFQKERLEAFLKLAEFRRDRMKERSQYEWRMSIAFWALLIAATFYVRPRPPEIFLDTALCIMALLHIYFLMEVRKRNRLDSDFAFYYIDWVDNILGPLGSEQPRALPQWRERLKDTLENLIAIFSQDFWWSGTEIIITVGLSLTAYWLMGTFEHSTNIRIPNPVR